MNFNIRHSDANEGIKQCDAAVGIGASIDDNAVARIRPIACCGMDLVDQFVFSVRLKAYDFMTAGVRPRLQTGLNICQGCRAIDMGFTLAEQIEIWTIKDEKLCQGCALTKSYGSGHPWAGRHGHAGDCRCIQVAATDSILVCK